MNIIAQDNQFFVLRFDKGDEVFAGLAAFMTEQKITGCTFQGIGTCFNVELGYYNSHLKEYRRKPYYEDLEIISMIGSGAMLDGKPAIHAHGMFGRTDFTTIGGHIFKIDVLATCEVSLVSLNATMERKINPDFNLNLLV